MGGKNPKNLWWNDQVKAAVERKEAAWKEVLRVRRKLKKKDVLSLTKKKRESLNGIYIIEKKTGK